MRIKLTPVHMAFIYQQLSPNTAKHYRRIRSAASCLISQANRQFRAVFGPLVGIDLRAVGGSASRDDLRDGTRDLVAPLGGQLDRIRIIVMLIADQP